MESVQETGSNRAEEAQSRMLAQNGAFEKSEDDVKYIHNILLILYFQCLICVPCCSPLLGITNTTYSQSKHNIVAL